VSYLSLDDNIRRKKRNGSEGTSKPSRGNKKGPRRRATQGDEQNVDKIREELAKRRNTNRLSRHDSIEVIDEPIEESKNEESHDDFMESMKNNSKLLPPANGSDNKVNRPDING